MTLKEKIKELANLFFIFAKIGSMTFGGGLAMMPMIQKELIEKRGWITDEELLDYYAIGQSTPGIVAVNVSTFVGYKRMKTLGGIVATLGIVFPSLVIIMLLAKLIDSIDEFPVVQKALRGINVAVASLLTKVSLEFSKKTIKNLFSFIVAFVSFVLVYFFKVQSFFIIIGAIFLGLIIYFISPAIEKRKQRNLIKAEDENLKHLEDSENKNA